MVTKPHHSVVDGAAQCGRSLRPVALFNRKQKAALADLRSRRTGGFGEGAGYDPAASRSGERNGNIYG